MEQASPPGHIIDDEYRCLAHKDEYPNNDTHLTFIGPLMCPKERLVCTRNFQGMAAHDLWVRLKVYACMHEVEETFTTSIFQQW
jgi:hypothetical protein